MLTDLIHYRHPSGFVFIASRRLLAIIFFREDHFARSVWTSSSRPLTVFNLEDPGKLYWSFEQYVRTFLPTSDTDGPLPMRADIFRLSGHFLIQCGPNPDAR